MFPDAAGRDVLTSTWFDSTKKGSFIANEYTCVQESSVKIHECQSIRLESDFKLLFVILRLKRCVFPLR